MVRLIEPLSVSMALAYLKTGCLYTVVVVCRADDRYLFIYVCAELKDLINELEKVTDWFLLGLCLGLFESQLEVIKQDHKTNDERRQEVLATWARQEKPTWSKVVCALMEMGDHQVLASQIAEKYGISFC